MPSSYVLLPQQQQQHSTMPPSPPLLDTREITKIRNKHQLIALERVYDSYLNANQHLLLLHDIIEFYLDIRDALVIQIQRLQREEYKATANTNSLYNTDIPPQKTHYDHTYQSLLPPSLKLTPIQMIQGYAPCPNEPKEYKCGCLSIKYYSPCDCKRPGPVCKNPACNEKRYTNIKLHSYCLTHSKLANTKAILEQKLLSVKNELSYIRRNSNSMDYEDYQNSIAQYPQPKRISRYPWKNN